jgi:hypothetical protein
MPRQRDRTQTHFETGNSSGFLLTGMNIQGCGWLGYALVASSKSLAEVLRQARHKGSANPLVAWSDEIAEAPFGGW